MLETCEHCGSQNTFKEYLNETQTGNLNKITEILHCKTCGSNNSKLLPSKGYQV